MSNGRRIAFSGKIEPVEKYTITTTMCTQKECTKLAVYGLTHCFEHLPNCKCGKLAKPHSAFCDSCS